jgi:hypothetical protein
MDDEIDGIVRRDFPRSGDGYDRAAVDAHLEAVAARIAAGPGTAADHELVRAGRVLLAEIAGVRSELKRVSDALRDRSATIARTLDQLLDLEAEPGAPSAVHRPAADPVARPAPPPAPVADADDDAPLSRPAPVEVADEAPPPPPPTPTPPVEVAHTAPVAPAPVEVAGVADEPQPAAAASVDAAGLADARLVALDMALGGSSREEIAGELAARFELADPTGLAAEVLAAIG